MFLNLKFQSLSWPQVDHALTSTYRWYQMIANAIGILICFLYFVFFEEVQPWSTEWQTNLTMTIVLSASLMIIGVFSSKFWMKDIRRYVTEKIKDQPVSAALEKKSKQKIINLPLFSAVISMLNWSVAAIVMPFFYLHRSGPFYYGAENRQFFVGLIGNIRYALTIEMDGVKD